MCKGKRFIVIMCADSFKDSPAILQEYVKFLNIVEDDFEGANTSDEGLTIDDFYDWVMEPFHAILEDLPPVSGRLTLQDYFFGEVFYYTLHLHEGERLPLKSDQGEDFRWGTQISPEFHFDLPVFNPRQVESLEDNQDTKPFKVLADGTICFLKYFRWGDDRTAEREIIAYTSIKRADLPKDVLVASLHGVVRTDDGLILGLLLSYIDCDNGNLEWAMDNVAPRNLRERWGGQITYTLKSLHEAGIIWGDAKAANVLIDGNQDAWIVDFGGSYTEGWVDKEKAGTIQGDFQGLAKILDHLSINSEVSEMPLVDLLSV